MQAAPATPSIYTKGESCFSWSHTHTYTQWLQTNQSKDGTYISSVSRRETINPTLCHKRNLVTIPEIHYPSSFLKHWALNRQHLTSIYYVQDIYMRHFGEPHKAHSNAYISWAPSHYCQASYPKSVHISRWGNEAWENKGCCQGHTAKYTVELSPQPTSVSLQSMTLMVCYTFKYFVKNLLIIKNEV